MDITTTVADMGTAMPITDRAAGDQMAWSLLRHLVVSGFLLLAGGCAITGPSSPTYSLSPDYLPVELEETVFHPQQAFQCGPAALATVLDSSGVKIAPDQLTPQVYLPERHGSLQLELLGATRRNGRMPYQIRPDFTDLAEQVRAGRPVLVLQNVGFRKFPVWHYAVVIGIDPHREEIILRSGTERRKVMSIHAFMDDWSQGDHWGILTLRPGAMPANPDPARYLKAVSDLEAIGRYEDALAGYRSAHRHWPDNATPALGIASTLYHLGQLQESGTHYEQVLQRWPDNVIALNNLAMLRSELGCQREALRLIERAIAADSAHGGQLRNALLQSRDEILNADAKQCSAS